LANLIDLAKKKFQINPFLKNPPPPQKSRKKVTKSRKKVTITITV